jgi:hypothetical protein
LTNAEYAVVMGRVAKDVMAFGIAVWYLMPVAFAEASEVADVLTRATPQLVCTWNRVAPWTLEQDIR